MKDIQLFNELWMPHCPECGCLVPFIVAPHTVAGCRLATGLFPTNEFSVEYQVAVMVANYPSLYGRSYWARWRALNDILVTSGTGYEWDFGAIRLLEIFQEPLLWKGYKPSRYNFEQWEQYWNSKQFNKAAQMSRLRDEEMDDKQTFWYTPEQHRELSNKPAYLSNLDGDTNLENIPLEVSDDWFQACYAMFCMIELVPATYFDPFGNQSKYFDAAKQRFEKVTIVK